MPKFRFFYDYECPFCKEGYEALVKILPEFPGMEVEWRPIEAHPRPEYSHPHTDLCIQAYYIAEELGADITAFHKAMFQAVIDDRENVEKEEVLTEIIKGIVDKNKFLEILRSGKYAAKVKENNDLAYEKNEVWYVPAFRIPGGNLKDAPRLDAKGGWGLSKREIRKFLQVTGKR